MFGISVSGIKGSQKHLDVTSNNIANANTYGFKKSRAEFGDMYANSIFVNSKTSAGMGVQNTVVSQQFVQGALSGDTGNALDMAIQGNGFFVLSAAGSNAHTYTRNGAFQVDNQGYIVTATGEYLQGWNVNEDGSTTSLDLNATHNIQIPSDTGAPHESNNIGIGVNLPADKDPIGRVGTEDGTGNYDINWEGGINISATDREYGHPITLTDGTNTVETRQYFLNFDPKDPSTYTSTTSQVFHDSLGRAHTMTYYMIKLGPTGQDDGAGNIEPTNNTKWAVIPFVDGIPVDVAASGTDMPTVISVPDGTSSVANSNFLAFTVTFDSSGEMLDDSTVPANVTFAQNTALRDSLALTNDQTFANHATSDGTLHGAIGLGANPDQQLALDFNASQYGSSNFEITEAPTNDGYSTGVLTSMSVDENGVIVCEYSNGNQVPIAKVAMADFANEQGLTKVGDTQWRESIASGAAQAAEANTGSVGSIKGSNLELSNVDLTSELVELITAQRNYQANAQSLQTQNTVMDSILNIR